MSLIDPELETFYNTAAEEKRLTYGLGPLELERNQELIGRYLPAKGGVVLDIGGGPGVYSEWLANLGYEVTLIDPVLKLVQQAQRRSAKLKRPFKAIAGEARKLEFAADSADLVILHGPLYHLQERSARIQALSEAYRVLKKGGMVLGFAINHAVSVLTGLLNGMIHDDKFYSMCLEELQSGKHDPPATWPGVLPKAFFHRPDELRDELNEAGFAAEGVFAVEGMIWLDGQYFTSRSEPAKKESMMRLLRQTEQIRELLSFSPHLMIAGRKQELI
jgi:ubiquinone/menaquinone biosynthesis C-methylase UbiE